MTLRRGSRPFDRDRHGDTWDPEVRPDPRVRGLVPSFKGELGGSGMFPGRRVPSRVDGEGNRELTDLSTHSRVFLPTARETGGTCLRGGRAPGCRAPCYPPYSHQL